MVDELECVAVTRSPKKDKDCRVREKKKKQI